MSFTSKVKNELLAQKNADACCSAAELSAALHTAGSINISKEGLSAELSTDNPRIAVRLYRLIKKLFGADARVFSQKKSTLNKPLIYRIEANNAERMLSELGIIYLDEDNHRQIRRGTDPYIIEQRCCKISYLKGAFLAGGSVTIPSVKSDKSGYNLSMTFSGAEMAEDVVSLLYRFSINAATIQRKNNFTVYIKDGAAIADFLALIGASKSFIALHDTMLERDVKNNANRQTNCIFANINKTVKAALRQLEAINYIESTIGIGALAPPLQEIARLRQQHPDISLEDIADLSGNLTKSGVNHRMRKILETARKIKKSEKRSV
jgi:DNA-binding protein WhiA